MKTYQRTMLAVAIAATVFAAGCRHDDNGHREPPSASAIAHAQAVIAQPAWLRQHLPANTVSYLRIPSPWQMIGGVPNGRQLDRAAVDQANMNIVTQVRLAVAKDPALAKVGLTPYLVLWLDELRSPVEAVLVDPSGITSPAAHGLISAQLNIDSIAAMQARLDAMASPLVKTTLDASGTGQLADGGWVRFDAAAHRIYLYQGMKPTDRPGFEAVLADVARSGDHPLPPTMAALEPRIDTSGTGLFGWVSVRGVGGVAASQIPSASLGTLPADLVSKTDAIAFGWGTSQGRGGFRFVVHAPQSRLLGYLAPRSFDVPLKTAGAPRWVATLALPSQAQVAAFENNVNLDFGVDRGASYREWAMAIKAKHGVDPAGVAGLLGPEMVMFADNAGEFSALRVHDKKAFNAMLEDLAHREGWPLSVGDSGKASVHALTITHMGGSDASAALPPAVRDLIGRIGSHLYWVEEGDFLVFGKVPQALADRAQASLDTLLGDWLKARGYDGKAHLVGVTASSLDAHRDAYYAYIGLLGALGDIAGAPLDLRALPSASALDLPRDGVLGSALEVDGDSFAFSLTYEQNPVEFLTSGGSAMVAVAYVGIMAAIAVPAYQEYTERSQVTRALTSATAIQTAVAEYRATHGKFPASLAAAGAVAPDDPALATVKLGQGGAIDLVFNGTIPGMEGASLTLTPLMEGKILRWNCLADGVPPKKLPRTCQDESADQ